jgi:two-component system KDP operon response regulator KdpE
MRSEKVLLVDDEAAIRKLIRVNLERDGYAVVEAGDALDALSKLDESVSLLLTDLSMPCLNGVELMARALQQRPELPVLLMSGYREEYANTLDGRYCIAKPFHPQDLVKSVREALEGRAS